MEERDESRTLNSDGPVRVKATLTMDGNIGTRFLIDWNLTLDLASGRASLARVETERVKK